MAEVPDDYGSGPDKIQKPQPNRTESLKSHKLNNVKSVTEVSSGLTPGIDQEPEELKTQGMPRSAENVLLEPKGTPEKENSKESKVGLSSQTEAEMVQTTSWERGGDLEIPVEEKHEEPDLQPPGVSVDVLTEAPTETDTLLPTGIKVTRPTSLETGLSEETGQKVPEQSLREGGKEIDSEQNTPNFPSGKPKKLVEDLPPSKLTKSEITSEVTKPEFPDWKLKSTEEAALKPPEELQVKPTERLGREQLEQIEPKFPDKKPRRSTEEKVPKLQEEFKLEFSVEDPKEPFDEASLELSEKRTPEVPEKTQKKLFEENITEALEEISLDLEKEKKLDVEEETQEKSSKVKVPEPLEGKDPADLKEKPETLSKKSKSKETLVESTKKKDPVLQEQTAPEFPEKKLIESTEETGQVPPQMTKPEVQEKSQPETTKDKNLGLSDESKSREREFPKEDSPEPSTLKYPVSKDEQVYPEYNKKLSVKETNKTKNEYAFGYSRESIESSVSTDYEAHEILTGFQTDMNELCRTIPASTPQVELRDSVRERKDVVLPQELEKPGHKEPKIIQSIRPQFEHLKWSPEEVAEWISELGFPQYKECFTTSFISGSKLIHVNCSSLPQMGITDFEDMKKISHYTRELLGITEPLFSRSISLPYRDNIGLFLERKGHSGVKSDSLTFSEFVEASGLQKYDPEIKAMDKNENPLPDNNQEQNKDPGMVTQAFNPRTLEAEAGGSL